MGSNKYSNFDQLMIFLALVMVLLLIVAIVSIAYLTDAVVNKHLFDSVFYETGFVIFWIFILIILPSMIMYTKYNGHSIPMWFWIIILTLLLYSYLMIYFVFLSSLESGILKQHYSEFEVYVMNYGTYAFYIISCISMWLFLAYVETISRGIDNDK
jgi:hypothetical protein